jgi:hypothetical protein
LYVNVYDLNCYIFIAPWFVRAYPHLNVISGVLWQLLVEPWRGIEGTAHVLIPTTFSIPQRFQEMLAIQRSVVSISSLAKIILSHKGWRCGWRTINAGASGCPQLSIGPCSKGPNVLSWGVLMGKTDAIYIVIINSEAGCAAVKGIR